MCRRSPFALDGHVRILSVTDVEVKLTRLDIPQEFTSLPNLRRFFLLTAAVTQVRQFVVVLCRRSPFDLGGGVLARQDATTTTRRRVRVRVTAHNQTR